MREDFWGLWDSLRAIISVRLSQLRGNQRDPLYGRIPYYQRHQRLLEKRYSHVRPFKMGDNQA
jgi:hypothetical protein